MQGFQCLLNILGGVFNIYRLVIRTGYGCSGNGAVTVTVTATVT
jgi:hypothetical protein